MKKLFSYNGEVNLIDQINRFHVKLNSDNHNTNSNSGSVKISGELPLDETLSIIDKRFGKSSEYKMFWVYTICLHGGCDFFIDGSLIMYICTTYQHATKDLLCYILSTIVGFQSFRRFISLISQKMFSSKRLDFRDRFILFQINKIILMYQTSSSNSIAEEQLIEIRTVTKQFIDEVNSSWCQPYLSMRNLESIEDNGKRCHKLWNYFNKQHPNLIKAKSMFMIFLIECRSEFVEAAITKREINSIENGRKRKKDKAFRMMISCFPIYLKKCIINANGHFMKNRFSNIGNENNGNNYSNNKNMNSGNDSLNQQMSSSSSFDEDDLSAINSKNADYSDLDQEFKEILTLPHLRMAFYKASKIPVPVTSKIMEGMNAFFLCLFLVILTILTIYLYNRFEKRLADSPLLLYYQNLRSNITITNILLLMKFMKYHEDYFHLWEIYNTLNHGEEYYHVEESTIDNSIRSSGYRILTTFQTMLNEYLSEQLSFKTIDYLLTDNLFPFQVCIFGAPLTYHQTNLKQMVVMATYYSLMLLKTDERIWLNESNDFCSIFSQYFNAIVVLNEGRNRIYQKNIIKAKSDRRLIVIFVGAISITLFLIFSLTYIVYFIKYIRALQNFINLMNSFDSSIKEKGSKCIHKLSFSDTNQSNFFFNSNNYNFNIRNQYDNECNDDNGSMEKELLNEGSNEMFHISNSYSDDIRNQKYYLYLLMFIIIIVIDCVAFFFVGYSAFIMSVHDVNSSFYSLYNSHFVIQSLELVESIFLGSILKHFKTNTTSLEKVINNIEKVLQLVDYSILMLFDNNDESPSLFGISEEIDNLYLKDSCYNPENIKPSKTVLSSSFSSSTSPNLKGESDSDILLNGTNYYCSSVSHLLTLLSTISRAILIDFREYEVSSFHSHSKEVNFFNLVNGFIIPKIFHGREFIIDYIAHKNKEHQNRLIYIYFIVFFCGFVTFMYVRFYKKKLNSIFKGGITLLRRLTPFDIVKNQKLIKFLFHYNYSSNSKNEEMTVTESIMHHSSDIIFYLTIDGIIERVNSAIYQNLSYTEDQLIGKRVEILFTNESREKVVQTVKMLQKNETSTTFTNIEVICISGDFTHMYFVLYMFKLNTEIVVILKNINDLKIKQQIAEESKAKSESLLYHIIPPFIVHLINNKEKDISLSINSATIMFIDIIKFSEFSALLTPQQILGTLSMICDRYDNKIINHKLLTKIKMIGDIYMCAGGLFDEQVLPKEHADECVKFGQDSIGIIEDINMKLNINLAIRIGINTGGPIIAGILGTDKLAFDIIGDPINVAARLQSTGSPNKIHISKETFYLVQNSGYIFENRGKTFLKGKGKVDTYLIKYENTD